MFNLSTVQQIALARTTVVLDALAVNPTAQPINEAAIGLLFSDVYGRGIQEGPINYNDEFEYSAGCLAMDLSFCGHPTAGSLHEIVDEFRELLARGRNPAEPMQTAEGEEDKVQVNLKAGLERIGKIFGGGDLSGFEVIDRAAKGKPTAAYVEEVNELKAQNPIDRLLTISPSNITHFELSGLLDGLKRNDPRAKSYLERNLSILLTRAGRGGLEEGGILWSLASVHLCFKIHGLLRGLQAVQLSGKVIRECGEDFITLMSLQALAAAGNLQAEGLLCRFGSKKGSMAEELLEALPIHQLAFRYVADRHSHDLLALTELANAGDDTARQMLEEISDSDRRGLPLAE